MSRPGSDASLRGTMPTAAFISIPPKSWTASEWSAEAMRSETPAAFSGARSIANWTPPSLPTASPGPALSRRTRAKPWRKASPRWAPYRSFRALSPSSAGVRELCEIVGERECQGALADPASVQVYEHEAGGQREERAEQRTLNFERDSGPTLHERRGLAEAEERGGQRRDDPDETPGAWLRPWEYAEQKEHRDEDRVEDREDDDPFGLHVARKVAPVSYGSIAPWSQLIRVALGLSRNRSSVSALARIRSSEACPYLA